MNFEFGLQLTVLSAGNIRLAVFIGCQGSTKRLHVYGTGSSYHCYHHGREFNSHVKNDNLEITTSNNKSMSTPYFGPYSFFFIKYGLLLKWPFPVSRMKYSGELIAIYHMTKRTTSSPRGVSETEENDLRLGEFIFIE